MRGTYKPQPVKRVEIPTPDGGVRKLGIPTVLDRFVQQAVMQVLQDRWDATFSEHSYGFRPGRSAHQAVVQAQQYLAEGYRWVVDLDLEKFFDRVHHDRLMARLARRIADKRRLKLIRAFLTAGVLEDGLVNPVDEGTPQLTRRTRGVSIECIAADLRRYLRGWLGYFGRCQTPSVLDGLDQWLRRRLRCVLWKQWKRGSVRYRQLRECGVSRDLAAHTAGSAHGPWRLANSPALSIALPNAYFTSLGIPRLTVAL